MEEPQSLPTLGDDRFEKTGETLRALREQANRTLDDHRRRLSSIETELHLQVQQISEEVARDCVVGGMEVEAYQQQQEELGRCQESLARAEAELEAFQERLVKIVAEQESQHATRSEELDLLQQQFQDGESERHRLAGELDQLRSSLSQAEADVATLREELSAQSAEHDLVLGAKNEEIAQLHEQHDRVAQEQEVLTGDLTAARCELEGLQNRECENCVSGREQLAEGQRNLAAAQEQSHALEDQLESLQEQHKQSQQTLAVAEENNEKAEALLCDAQQRILELSNNDELEDQLQQTRRKFDLALADVHKLKRENAELHEELVRRPEADDHESPELVSLRAERDALAARVAEMENVPLADVDAHARQEVVDLQSRFELAVEDVRQLKQENAELNERLKSGAASASVSNVAGNDALDWQAQKAKLLAELDAEDQGDVSPGRQEERTTIEGTISITDRVVEEKDRELAELRAKLEAKPGEESQPDAQQTALDEMFDQDEVIQAERERLQQVQQQWREKLRTAELELSIQRATLAREQAALEEGKAKLREAEPKAETPSDGKPGRRWLSALGLKDEDRE